LRRCIAGRTRPNRQTGALSEIFFVNERGGPLDAGVLGRWFGKLTGKAGLRPIREGARRASLHSFRHSFAVRRLRVWHEAGQDVQALLPTLSVYLGHVRPEDTYWYLTATPDLLRAAGSRFTPDGVVGGAP
jgi:integrase/recombinase XerD